MLMVTQLAGFGGLAPNLDFNSYSTYSGSSASSHDVTMPSSFSAGDVLVAVFGNASNVALSSVSGWTPVGSASNGAAGFGAVYYKVATGSDTMTVGLASSSTLDALVGALGPSTGITGTPTFNSSTTSDITLSAVTTGAANSIVVAAGRLGGGALTTPSGFSVAASYTTGLKLYLFTKLQASAGSTGTVAMNQSLSTLNVGGLLAVKP